MAHIEAGELCVVRKRDRNRAKRISNAFDSYQKKYRELPGIDTVPRREALLEQLMESLHRVEYIAVMQTRDVSPLRSDPRSNLFDPIKAAELKRRSDQTEEAFWLVFLATHFGKNLSTGWRLVRDVYGKLGQGGIWLWDETSNNPDAFSRWLSRNRAVLQGEDGVKRYFGNHRKYESLNDGTQGTNSVVQSYIDWALRFGSHSGLISDAYQNSDGSPEGAFDYLYKSMTSVARFGRTARFDYLTMLGKLRLAKIEPGRPYLSGATGPLKGARLLFGGSKSYDLSPAQADILVAGLGKHLQLGMQVMEDALCNWQKAPNEISRFRG